MNPTPEQLRITLAKLEAKGVKQDSGKPLEPTGSVPEEKFHALWLACGGPPLCREHRIFGERKWRADFAHLTSQTIIEIDGAVAHGIWRTRKDGKRVWVPGGHGMEGRVRDCERDLECILNGWRVVRLVPSMITVENIERLVAFVKGILWHGIPALK